MKHRRSPAYVLIKTAIYLVLACMAVACIFPVVHVLALSFSSSTAAASGRVTLLPVEFTLKSYRFVVDNDAFSRSFGISVQRVLLGFPLNMLLTLLVAYPLSRERAQFRARGAFAWFFLITILFGGGLIPWYMVIRMTGLIDSIWALVIPSAVPVFNVILLMNFFKSLPGELEEAAFMDGASHWTILCRIFVPLSAPALATISLFVIVGHWNSWFDGLILMNSPDKYPLQSYLQTIIINRDPKMLTERDLDLLKVINERTTKAAQIFVAMLPVMCVYPFLQKYFTTGIVVGAVKG